MARPLATHPFLGGAPGMAHALEAEEAMHERAAPWVFVAGEIALMVARRGRRARL